MRWLVGLFFVFALGLTGCSETSGVSADNTIEWAASTAVASERELGKRGYGITANSSANSEFQWLTNHELDDFKPVYSPDGAQIAFFRVFDYGDGSVFTYGSKIFVMDADGSNLRELTTGEHSDYNPYWTRNGTNQITFTRFAFPFSEKIYRTSPDAEPGDEQLISHPDPEYFEFGYSSLEDGRILIRRDLPGLGYYLMTPNPGGTPTYEQISYPTEDTYLHKMTISTSETKVAYMKVEGITVPDILAQRVYLRAIVSYADFDADNLRFDNEVEITEYDTSVINGYPHWDADGQTIIYADSVSCPIFTDPDCVPSGVINAYSLRTGTTRKISSHDELVYRYAAVVGTAK